MPDRWEAIALALAVSSNLFFSIVDALIQHGENLDHIPPAQLTMVRMSIGRFVGNLPPLALLRPDRTRTLGPPDVRLFLWIRGSLAILATYFGILSFAKLTLSEGTTLFSIRPFPIAFLCWLWLGEAFTRAQVVGCFVSMFAVGLIAYPQVLGVTVPLADDGLDTSTRGRLEGLATGLACVFFAALDSYYARRIGGRSTSTQMLVMYGVYGLVVPPVYMLLTDTSPVFPSSVAGWSCLVGLIPADAGAQLTLTIAFQYLAGGVVAMTCYSQIVFGVLAQAFIYKVWPTWPAVLGMVIIAVTGLLTIGGDQVVADKDINVKDEEAMLPLVEVTRS